MDAPPQDVPLWVNFLFLFCLVITGLWLAWHLAFDEDEKTQEDEI
jgi:hypothetical protein